MSSFLEFQAVVLAAGIGSRMSEITLSKPKCLLPVGAKPLLWYPLYKLQTAGFKDTILIVLESQKKEIENSLDDNDLDIKIDYETISDAHEDLGTAGSLRLIYDKLKSDVLVISCDLITDISLKGVLDTFRMHDASIASLLLHPQEQRGFTGVPGPPSKHKPERDLIGIDNQTNRFVFLSSASDYENEISLPTGLFRKHTNIKMYSNLVDSHVYVLKKWVIEYLHSDKKFTSIKGDLLPHIIKKQLTKPQSTESLMTNCPDNLDIYSLAKESEDVLKLRKASSFNDHFGDLKSAYHDDCIRCYAYLAPKDSFGIRVNTLPAFCYVNHHILEKWPKITYDLPLTPLHPKAEIKSNQVDDGCIVLEGAKLSEKTAFKKSIIGRNSSVASFSRVFNSILMNNVTILENVALENCIVCNDVTIEKGCKIKNCVVSGGQTIAGGSEHTNELLTESSHLMEF